MSQSFCHAMRRSQKIGGWKAMRTFMEQTIFFGWRSTDEDEKWEGATWQIFFSTREHFIRGLSKIWKIFNFFNHKSNFIYEYFSTTNLTLDEPPTQINSGNASPPPLKIKISPKIFITVSIKNWNTSFFYEPMPQLTWWRSPMHSRKKLKNVKT